MDSKRNDLQKITLPATIPWLDEGDLIVDIWCKTSLINHLLPKFGQSDEFVGLGGLRGQEVEAGFPGGGEHSALTQFITLEHRTEFFFRD